MISMGCTIRPTMRAGEATITLGGSLFTKSRGEIASYQGPHGSLYYQDVGRDETVVPSKLINYYVAKSLINGATTVIKGSQRTTRFIAGERTTRQGIRSAAEVEKLRILNPAEELVPGVLPAGGGP